MEIKDLYRKYIEDLVKESKNRIEHEAFNKNCLETKARTMQKRLYSVLDIDERINSHLIYLEIELNQHSFDLAMKNTLQNY